MPCLRKILVVKSIKKKNYLIYILGREISGRLERFGAAQFGILLVHWSNGMGHAMVVETMARGRVAIFDPSTGLIHCLKIKKHKLELNLAPYPLPQIIFSKKKKSFRGFFAEQITQYVEI